MIPLIPWYITTIVLATNLTIAVAVWTLVSSTAGRSDLPLAARRTVRIGSGLFLGAWLGAALLLAPAPASLLGREQFYLTPLVPLFAAVPPAIVALALGFSPALRRAVAAVPLPALIGVQFYRVVGAVFLILLAQGRIPAHFALPAGWGDVAIGLAAPVIALALARRVRGARPLAIAWNALGLLDLVVAVGMGTGFLAPLLVPELGRVPPAAAMGAFPMILVPTFAVPVSALLHLLALARLLREVRLGSGLVPKVATGGSGRA
ncbi:MAG: hypothetical protein ACREOC_11710 [Gemmatimonadales bacterium]